MNRTLLVSTCAMLLFGACATPSAPSISHELGSSSLSVVDARPPEPIPGFAEPSATAEPEAYAARSAEPSGWTTPEAIPSVPSSVLQSSRYDRFSPEPSRGPHWSPRTVVLQGYFGVTMLDDLELTGGLPPDIDGSNVNTLPSIGGGAQMKLGGERIDWGVEALLAFNWRANAVAFTSGSGGGSLAVNVNLLLFEIYGGPFASVFLGDDWRLYGAVGPTLQWGSWDQDNEALDDSGNGFGVGGYARGGLEYRWSNSTMIGLGARYFDSTIDLNSSLGDLDISGTQVYLTVTQGF